jgi:ribonuclease P protein component
MPSLQRHTYREKLKSRTLLKELFGQGKSLSVYPVKTWYLELPAGSKPILTGVGVSARNFKKAVDRNRIKRLLREAYRLQKQPLLDNLQTNNKSIAVFFLYIGKELPVYDQAKKAIAETLQKLSDRLDKKQSK